MSLLSYLSTDSPLLSLLFFFFHHTATTAIYTLSLHDALPICPQALSIFWYPVTLGVVGLFAVRGWSRWIADGEEADRSEEHTSELQSLRHLVCRLLLEKKKNTKEEEE